MIQKLKGTYDIYGSLAKKHEYLNDTFKNICESFNYSYIDTPIFEKSELFHRSVGETTDIVSKETYDFVDRGGRNNTLRPEGTAGIARSIIENKLYTVLPLKLYYSGPMFRYERPQKGRYRELRQIGVELYGSNNPVSDAEVINLGYKFLKTIGLKNVIVRLNSIGGKETREKYRNALKNHFKNDIDDFCEDCKNRFDKNPLRILDCKVDNDNKLIKEAPSILDYLSEEEKNHFESVKRYLDLLEIEYIVDSTLVRGLDYYTNTVFEFESKDIDVGALGGGGRYNNLLESLGGPSTPSVGFAFGFDRLVCVIEECGLNLPLDESLDAYLLNISENELDYTILLLNNLRDNGFKVDMDITGKTMKAKFKESDRYNSKFVIIIGEEEVKNNIVTVRDNITKEESKIEYDNLIDYLDINI